MEFAVKYCGDKSIVILKKRHQYSRKCFPNFKNYCPDRHTVQEKCKNGPAGVVTDGFRNYRNIWCSICWQIPPKLLRCGPFNTMQTTQTGLIENVNEQMGLAVLSFSISINLSSGRYNLYVVSSCSKGEIYDSYLETCRTNVASLPKEAHNDKYLVAVWLKSDNTRLKISYIKLLYLVWNYCLTFVPHKCLSCL